MPLVRVTGWQRGSRPSLPPAPLSTLLIEETGMDGTDAEAAVHRLMKGKFVDASFDARENRAALAFMRKMATFGLAAKLYPDEPLSTSGSPPRPLFLKLSLAVLVGFVICLFLCGGWPQTTISKVCVVVEFLLIMCWLYSTSGGILDRESKAQGQTEWQEKPEASDRKPITQGHKDWGEELKYWISHRRPKTQAQKEWEQKLRSWWIIGTYAFIGLIGLIIFEPIYAAVLLAVAVVGIGCAFLIRVMNRS